MATHDLTTPPADANLPPLTPVGTSRRRLFGAGAALAILPAAAAVAAPSPDAQLLRLCAEFHACHGQSDAYDDEPEWEAWLLKRDAAADAIEDIVPATVEGLRAKAAVAVFLLEEVGEDEMLASDYSRMAFFTLRNVAGVVA